MNKSFKSQLNSFLKLLDKEHKLALKIKNARDQLSLICIHPKESITDYRWHHGYGKYITGYHCGICLKVDVWKRSYWISQDQIYKDSD